MTTTPTTPAETINKPLKNKWWRTKKSLLVMKISGAVAFLALLVWWIFFHPYVSTDDARVAATLVRVASQGIAGRIEKLNVEEGSKVKKGDILIETEHRTAEAQLARARSKAELAVHDLKRAEQLSAQNGLPARDLDKARAEAGISDAELKLAEVALDNTFLKSPIDGIVVQKTVEVGDMLEPGQTALSVADVDHAWVSANIEETSVGDVKPGQNVSVSVDEGGHLRGQVLEVRAAAAAQFALIPSDNAAGNFTKLVQRIPIKVSLDPHPDKLLRVGQSVEISIRVH